ncbi:MAG: bifunctional diguanylate cyclase/phosphodiesterase [Clostridiaceae bacterium]|nr:bifunctional diguanylate cyclase/phosphodiesterase [Clostridiaceae bacterium]
METLLREILHNRDIKSVFQPIISLRDGSILGFEALSRGPVGSPLESPALLFSIAEQYGCLWDLELLCRTKALSELQKFEPDCKIFLNVNPSIIEDRKFQQGFTKGYLKQYKIDPQHIIFEITERSAIRNISDFKKIIKSYRDQDYEIAIDDAGAGYSGLNLISDIHPQYLKLDMNLIHGIDRDSVKQALVRSLCEFTRITGTALIAEGIETVPELQTLIDIGVHYGQGYLIQRPGPFLAQISDHVTQMIVDQNARKNHIYGYNLSEIYIGNLCIGTPTVNETVTISQAYEMLKCNERTPGFCITRSDGSVQGVVTRDRLNAVMSGLYGYNLHSRKNISTVMNVDFLSMDLKTPVNTAGRLAMSRPDETVYDFITVTLEGKYYGIVTIKDLLNKTIEIEVSNATQLNPLTALPGNILIERKLNDLLRQKEASCVLYIDIDNFKAYNDVYGFENGDRIIKYLADIITHMIPEPNFVGHVGGDDFVVLIYKENLWRAEALSQKILNEFEKTATAFYKEEDKRNGYLLAVNRNGFMEQFPLISLSIAGVLTEGKHFADIFEITERASKIKKDCKQISGNSLLIL